jgi:hypothetical protein
LTHGLIQMPEVLTLQSLKLMRQPEFSRVLYSLQLPMNLQVRLRVAEGDTVTAEYEDNTLPDPYTTSDELNITVQHDQLV